jgi:hypothetical protein
MKNKITAQEAVELLIPSDPSMTVQKLYSFRDLTVGAKNPRRPIAKRGTDWDCISGRIYFSQDYIEVVKNWRENSNSVKAKTSSMKTSNLQATVIVDGDATELKGNLAKKAIRLVEKNKTDVNLPDNQELKETV